MIGAEKKKTPKKRRKKQAWGTFLRELVEVHVIPTTRSGIPVGGHEPTSNCFCCPTRAVTKLNDPMFVHHQPY